MEDEIEGAPIVVEPGDTIEVAEDAGDVHDDDSVVINDNSFDSATDESVNVVVNVELPEETNESQQPEQADESRFASLESRVAALESSPEQEPALEELPPEETPLEESTPAEDVVDVSEDAPAEVAPEPKAKKKTHRRFGR